MYNAQNFRPAGTANDQFDSDTQKIVRRHLQDKNHVITDEELRNVRIGTTPPAVHAFVLGLDPSSSPQANLNPES